MARKNKDRIAALEADIRDLRAEVEALRAWLTNLSNKPDPMRPIGPRPDRNPQPEFKFDEFWWWQNPVISNAARSEALPSAKA